MRKIVVEEYNSQWEEEFLELRFIYEEALRGDIKAIEHVGSTSVKGLAAKPILDIDIIIDNEDNKELVIEKLRKLGYKHRGDLGIIGREAFERIDNTVPKSKKVKMWMKHNLYLCVDGVESLENHLKFRDYLRENPSAVEEYGDLKRRLAAATEDIDEYVENKSTFICGILRETGMKIDSLKRISEQNRK